MRQKVIDATERLGLDIEVRTLDAPTRTVDEAAAAVGADRAQIAKSLVFLADGDPILAVVSGAHRVDSDALALSCDCAVIEQASPDDVRAATRFAVGGVPPFAPDLRVVFDEALLQYDRIWAAGGDGNTLFEVDPKLLAKAIGARILPVGERSAA